jgi:ankyrin repeat protein
MKKQDLNQKLFREVCRIRTEGVKTSSLTEIQNLIDEGASMTYSGNPLLTSPLVMAAQNDMYAVVELFIKNHVDINSASFSMYKGKGFSATALYSASEKGLTNMVELLLKHGASTEMSENSPVSPMHIAAENNHKSVVELLHNNGGRVDLPDLLFHKTALDLARENKCTEVFTFVDLTSLNNVEISGAIIEIS